jgi:hypothetical protein
MNPPIYRIYFEIILFSPTVYYPFPQSDVNYTSSQALFYNLKLNKTAALEGGLNKFNGSLIYFAIPSRKLDKYQFVKRNKTSLPYNWQYDYLINHQIKGN